VPAGGRGPRWRRVALLATWPAVLLVRVIADGHPAAVEAAYSRRLYRALAAVLVRLTSLVPFSMAEIGLAALLLAAGVLIVRGAIRLWRGPQRLRRLARATVTVVGWAGVVYLAFELAWGLNYARRPLADTLGLSTGGGGSAELAALAKDLLAESVALREGLPEDGAGALRIDGGLSVVARRAPTGYQRLFAVRPALSGTVGRAKPVLLSPLMSYLGIGGIYAPFTGEANVNATLPDWDRPFTVCHELAHQRGFAREDEANYLAYLACRSHPDRDFQYSGTFQAALYVLGALRAADRPAYDAARGRLAPPLQRDLAALAAWRARYASPLSRVQDRVNDTYLRSQGQREGLLSYGRMVDLLLAERRAAGQR
jgi:hypothetical protein